MQPLQRERSWWHNPRQLSWHSAARPLRPPRKGIPPMKRLTPLHLISSGCVALFALGAPSLASAQEDDVELEESEEGEDFEPETEGEAEAEAAPPEADDSDWSPVEKQGETYYSVCARYRAVFVPQGLINLFADGGRTFCVNAFGAEFGVRRDNFEILPAISFANYSFDTTPFKGKTDGADAWELVEANLTVLYLTADFLWSTPINDQFAINY